MRDRLTWHVGVLVDVCLEILLDPFICQIFCSAAKAKSARTWCEAREEFVSPVHQRAMQQQGHREPPPLLRRKTEESSSLCPLESSSVPLAPSHSMDGIHLHDRSRIHNLTWELDGAASTSSSPGGGGRSRHMSQPSMGVSGSMAMSELPPPYTVVDERHSRHNSISTPSSDRHSLLRTDSYLSDAHSMSSLDLFVSADDLRARPLRQRFKPSRSGLSDSHPVSCSTSALHSEDELDSIQRSNPSNSGLSSMVPSFLSTDSPRPSRVETTEEVEPLQPLPMAFAILLHSLRLFAVVPGAYGTMIFLRRAYIEGSQGRWLRESYKDENASAVEYIASMLWTVCTAFHALSVTTLLLRRWLIYYTIIPTLIRLVTFQSISWSLVRLVLYASGQSQPLGAWVAVSTFTAFFEIFARWTTSNITDIDEPSSHDHGHSDVNETGISDGEGLSHFEHDDMDHQDLQHPWVWQLSRERRYRLYREQGLRFFRALMGGPTDTVDTDSDLEPPSKQSLTPSVPTSSASSTVSVREIQEWHRRIDERRQRKLQDRTRRKHLKKKSRMSMFFQNYRAARIHSRRVFHWEVAMWRNVMPVGVLAYVTLWILLIEFSFTRHLQS